MASVSYTDGDAGNADAVERVSSRPDFTILGYAWLNAMQPNEHNWLNYCVIFADDPVFSAQVSKTDCSRFAERYSPVLYVNAKTPPTFLYMTTDDKTVPVESNVAYYSALHAAGVSAEMHLFRHGGHGSGLGWGDATLDEWPGLLEHWLRDQGLFSAPHPK